MQLSRSQRKTVLLRTNRIMKQPVFSYLTIAFIAPVVFLCCTNDRDGYSHRLITTVLSSGKRCYFLYQAYLSF